MRSPDRSLVLAAGGFAAAALVFAAALARALTVEPTPPDAGITAVAGDAPVAQPPDDAAPTHDGAAAPATDDGGAASARRPTAGRPEVDEGEARALTLEALTLAVDNDPFQPDRRRPDEPYRMPGEDVDEPEAPPPPPPPPPFQLLGTAEMIEGGIAVLRVEESLPRVMTVGEYVMGYRLDAVKGDAATLTGQGQTVTLTVAQASPHPEPERSPRGERENEARARGSAAERAREQREQVLQRALEQQLRRQEGAAMEELRRLMEQRGQPGRDIRFENGRIIIRGDTSITVNRRGGGGEERR